MISASICVSLRTNNSNDSINDNNDNITAITNYDNNDVYSDNTTSAATTCNNKNHVYCDINMSVTTPLTLVSTLVCHDDDKDKDDDGNNKVRKINFERDNDEKMKEKEEKKGIYINRDCTKINNFDNIIQYDYDDNTATSKTSKTTCIYNYDIINNNNPPNNYYDNFVTIPTTTASTILSDKNGINIDTYADYYDNTTTESTISTLTSTSSLTQQHVTNLDTSSIITKQTEMIRHYCNSAL